MLYMATEQTLNRKLSLIVIPSLASSGLRIVEPTKTDAVVGSKT